MNSAQRIESRVRSMAVAWLASATLAALLVACGGGEAVGPPDTSGTLAVRSAAASAAADVKTQATAMAATATAEGPSTAAAPKAVSAAATSTRSTFIDTPLLADVSIRGTVSDPFTETVVLGKELTLRAGESRRVVDRLALDLTSTSKAEVDNAIACSYLDSDQRWKPYGDRSSSGTNHLGSASGQVVLSNSLLLKAANAGNYRCDVLSYTSNGRSDYFEIARAAVSSLQISAFDEVGSQQWVQGGCDSQGTFPGCVYVNRDHPEVDLSPLPPDPQSATLWTAAPGATEVEVLGTIQVTSCPYGTASCVPSQWGPNIPLTDWSSDKNAQIESTLHFDQLYPDGTVCRSNASWDQTVIGNVYGISNDVHHLPIHYGLYGSQAIQVSPNCRGSRTFKLSVHMRWHLGNPVKIDGGTITAISSVRTDSAALPNVVGSNSAQAITSLKASGFAPVVVLSAINPAPVGTVFDQNSPAGTVEPVGSRVELAVSLGSATVPDVRGAFENRARQRIVAANLTVGTVSHPNTCVDPGTVSEQSLAPGTLVVPGTSLSLTVPSCSGGPRQ